MGIIITQRPRGWMRSSECPTPKPQTAGPPGCRPRESAQRAPTATVLKMAPLTPTPSSGAHLSPPSPPLLASSVRCGQHDPPQPPAESGRTRACHSIVPSTMGEASLCPRQPAPVCIPALASVSREASDRLSQCHPRTQPCAICEKLLVR